MVLDRSGSMRGDKPEPNPWSDLLKSVKGFLKGLSDGADTSKDVKVSIIGYDDVSRVLYEKVSAQEDLVRRIDWTGGDTDFERPLADAYRVALRSQDEFDRFHIYFMSDGSAAYPAVAIDEFKGDSKLYDNAEVKFVAFGKDADQFTLGRMKAAFKGGKLHVATTSAELQKTFDEEIEHLTQALADHRKAQLALDWVCQAD